MLGGCGWRRCEFVGCIFLGFEGWNLLKSGGGRVYFEVE